MGHCWICCWIHNAHRPDKERFSVPAPSLPLPLPEGRRTFPSENANTPKVQSWTPSLGAYPCAPQMISYLWVRGQQRVVSHFDTSPF